MLNCAKEMMYVIAGDSVMAAAGLSEGTLWATLHSWRRRAKFSDFFAKWQDDAISFWEWAAKVASL
jgi:hypothetical protein